MTREEEIIKQVEIYTNNSANLAEWSDGWEDYNDYKYVEKAFINGAKWSDEHPDSKRIYTKQQLFDMGFAFTTNGDIVTPNQLNEDLKKYLEYRKQKFIEKGKEWISESYTSGVLDWKNCDSIIERFCKAMEESLFS